MPNPPPDQHEPHDRLVRAERPLGDVDPCVFLLRAAGLPRGLCERDGRWSAWAGTAARLRVESPASPSAEVRERAEAVLASVEPAGADGAGGRRGCRFYGGFAFDPGDPRPAERPFEEAFPAAHFHLPALEIRGGEGPASAAATVRVPRSLGAAEARRTAERTLERIAGRLEATGTSAVGDDGRPPSLVCREAIRRPDRPGWGDLVEAALAAVRGDELEKVVPARLLELALDEPPDPVLLLERLRADNPGTFPFLVEPVPGSALLGAAPEIVASRAEGLFEATAVAGTVPEGEGREERERLARRLLESEKDRVEHEVGVRDMREALLSVAGVADVDAEPSVLRLRGMQHLLTHLSARVPEELHLLELLAAMHPTAAVNGRPRGEALRFLREREPFRRGWFAGPVGWFDGAGDGAFVPALRSALLRGDRVRLFAGAGIVEGSEAEAEWEETSVKLRPVLRALGLESGDVAAGAGSGAAVSVVRG